MDKEGMLSHAVAFLRAGRLDESEAAFMDILSLGQNEPEALRQMAGLYALKRDYITAVRVLKQALAYETFHADTWRQLGAAYSYLGENADAREAMEMARQLVPTVSPIVEWHYALDALARGDYEDGFRAYEWGKVCGMRPVRTLGAEWDGKRLPEGSTLFIWSEQGMGDALQFLRFVKAAKERSGVAQVVLEVQEPLVGLLVDFPDAQVVAARRDGCLPCMYEAHCALLSLPYILGVRTERDIARLSDMPYLFARPDRVEVWRQRLQEEAGSDTKDPITNTHDPLKIGFCWQGSATHPNDAARSLQEADFAQFKPLLEMEGIAICALHLGAMPDGEHPLLDWVETAAVIANLDLVISVDTCVAHLAGAMGKPVYLLLAKASDWRWGRNKGRTLWYPSVMIFQQERQGDWSRVVSELMYAMQQSLFFERWETARC